MLKHLFSEAPSFSPCLFLHQVNMVFSNRLASAPPLLRGCCSDYHFWNVLKYVPLTLLIFLIPKVIINQYKDWYTMGICHLELMAHQPVTSYQGSPIHTQVTYVNILLGLITFFWSWKQYQHCYVNREAQRRIKNITFWRYIFNIKIPFLESFFLCFTCKYIYLNKHTLMSRK